MLSAHNGHLEVVWVLLDWGADKNLRDKERQSMIIVLTIRQAGTLHCYCW
jgi:hypothetical protein